MPPQSPNAAAAVQYPPPGGGGAPREGAMALPPRPVQMARRERDTGIPAAPMADNDALVAVLRSMTTVAAMAATFAIPKDMRLVWVLVVSLMVLGNLGLSLFYASVIASTDPRASEEDRSKSVWWAKTVLFATSSIFFGVLAALLVFLAFKVISVAIAKNSADKMVDESDRKELERRKAEREVRGGMRASRFEV